MQPEARQRALRCLTVLGTLGSCSLLGVAFSLYLVNHAPLLLIALSPLGRHLILVAPIVDPVAFLVIAAARRGAFYGASFELGRTLGPEGLPWLEQRAARFARFVRWLERLFARAPRLVVLCFSGPSVSGLAGIHGMSRRLFALLALPGLLVRLAVVLWFGDWLEEPIERVLAFIDRHWVSGTVVLVAALAVQQWRRRQAWLRSRGA